MFSEGNSWMLYDLLNAFRFDDVEKLAASLEAGSAETLDNYDFLSDNQGQWISLIPVGTLTHGNVLHGAVWYSAHRCLAYLLEHGFARQASKPTTDGTTPLHLAAAVGDFVASDLLLRYNASTKAADQFGRIPLHHAATTDICIAVQLCAVDATALSVRDWESKDPLEISFQNQCMDTARFLALAQQKSGKRGDRKSPRSESRLQQLRRKPAHVKESTLWIPYNLKAPRCIKIQPKTAPNEDICECNLPVKEHGMPTKNPVLKKRFATYDGRFIRVPSPTFGELTHPANNYLSQYVRSVDELDLSKLTYFFESVWSLQRPQLVLTFYGDEASSSTVKESLRKLVWKASDSTLTWILTDGLQRGISPTVSEATKHYIEAYGLGLVESIGIVPWRRVCCISNMSPDTYMGNPTAKYEMVEEDSVLHENLDANMTAYFFVDTEDRPARESTFMFRSKMETALRNWAVTESLGESQQLAQSKIQMCGILSGGDEGTLKSIHTSLSSGTPFVVLKETGGLASILCECIEDTEIGERNIRKKALTEGSRESAVFQLSPANIRETVMSHWEEVAQPDLVVLLIQDILDKREMICVCDLEEEDLDYHVLLLLIRPATEGVEVTAENNIAKLEIAIALNRSDVARERVFLDGMKWDNERLGAYMSSFLLRDNVPFMKLFLEKGFDLKSYLTRGRLEMLYTLSLVRAKQKKPLLNVIRRFMRTPTRVTLFVVGRILTLLMGNRYYPVYMGLDFLENDEKAKAKILSCPATHLFIWALLTERKESAELFWTQLEEPLGAALMAAALLRHYCHYADSTVNRDELEELSSAFETKACGLLSECFADDPASTAEVLIRERALFGHMSCMMLASNGKCLSFVAHRCSEQYLELVWCGNIDPQTSRFSFFIGVLVGILMPPLVPFTLKFAVDRNRKRELEENQENEDEKRPLSSTASLSEMASAADNERPKRKGFSSYRRKLVGFYNAPMVRFAYATMSHLIFLCFFIYALLFDYKAQKNYDMTTKLILLFWVFTYFVENVRQGISSGLSFRDYMKRIWKSLELVAIILFIIGTALHLMLVAEMRRAAMPVDLTNTVQQTLYRMGQIFYGMSLFLFFYRLLEAFTADRRIGPLVVMIQSMVVKDLMPFMSLLVVALFSFALLQWAVAYTGTASESYVDNSKTLFEALKLAYFQMFGEYQLEDLTTKKSDDCKTNKLNCVDGISEWLAPIILAIFVILTQVLLLNLLIAMFTSTYERIESSATGYWSLQRYQVICEFVDRSVFPPPLIIIWHIYLLFRCMGRKCMHSEPYGHHPFKKSYAKDKAATERRLIQWERLRFWDYQRYVLHGRRRKNKASKSVNVRTTVMGGHGGASGTQISQALQSLQDGTNEGIRSLLEKLNRVDEVDRKADQILRLLRGLQEEVGLYRSLQTRSAEAVEDLGLRQVPPRRWPPAKLVNLLSKPLVKIGFSSPPSSPAKVPTHVPLVQASPSDMLGEMSDKPSNMIVISGQDHKLAMFYPPTSDATPSLFAEPVPWSAEKLSDDVLGWRPHYSPIEGWTESNDFVEAMTSREWNPMGTTYVPPAEQVPPDPETGMPRNPNGRTGVVGKGLLPVWGPNPAIIMVLTRYTSASSYGPGELQAAVCELQITRQLPWVFRGYLNDMVNTDNAWIEPTGINIHLGTHPDISDALLHLFVPEDCCLRWTRAEDQTPMRTSHRVVLDMTTRRLKS
ncbi:Transient receptor putative cation channel sub M member 2 [Clonorchis sinensis]|uniref:Transient receptor putative cation channel sub M member 2 n=1 Tax=Clonorchis sinensis TaxID=79923 RepID=A0A8T1MCN5_CLOSI|nr:Transient receptor putative cation channel sub M member 2 [Clonorchis sinensis]